MPVITSRLIALAIAIMFISCSSTKEEIKEVKPEPVVTPTKPPEVDTRVFRFDERYFVRDAAIDKETNIEDPLQAIRVIQLKQGNSQVLVISQFENVEENGEKVGYETWMAVEMPSLEMPGKYDVGTARNVRFFRFRLGDKSLRMDGQSFSGSIKVESLKDGHLIGSVSVEVSGVTKSFDETSRPFKTVFAGSFRIKEVPLEATIMKSR